MELVTIGLRTVFAYFFILVVFRIMGKREIAKLSVFDLVVSLMIAELAVISLENTREPMINSLIPIAILLITQISLSYISLKSEKIRSIVDGKPTMIIEHGKIKDEEMKKQRYNLNDLLLQLRENKIHSISQVEFAILEPTGKLTVFPKDEEQVVTKKDLNLPHHPDDIPHILIKDGVIQDKILEKLGKNRFWLKSELKKRTGSSDVKKIMLCSVEEDGDWYIDPKDEKE